MEDGAFSDPREMITDRLLIRKVKISDAEAFHVFKSDVKVTERYGQEPKVSINGIRKWIERNLQDQIEGRSLLWAVVLKEGGGAIGTACLWNFDPDHKCAEIGYEISPSFMRKGLMSEAIQAIISFGFDELRLHRIEAVPLANNRPSRDLLEKLGFAHEGIMRERVHFRGEYLDQVSYGLLAAEWPVRVQR